mmetsp:Transcript_62187/g.166883  ORF Transcript_62187/g.166883 Transcript_62187/m.166883 type:complete len:193 (+) Transcript_62187:40-618(+)|eukprot:CAMPEP_0113692570 /NCGR_PEP_ID=MMETSP0038_2-20120614/19159_1 /TAXON_ID=2898 /ORGANISM="Cryptomonas paramecium" /LENGTH=192 /DNA_ID=CAMNT_0000614499 /DNA_START=16 /DNA_END=594 /DNA_ORIENTATION=- /assembly_acc=CAM_ASM_000170
MSALEEGTAESRLPCADESVGSSAKRRKWNITLGLGLAGSIVLLCMIALIGGDRQAISTLTSAEDNNGGTNGEVAQTGGASDFIKSSDLGDYVDAIIGPAPSGLTEGGYKKRGSIAVSKIDASGFYYLNIEGEPGHAIKCILQGSDGYHRHWKGYGQIYTGPIHEGNYGQKDYLQIQDLVTGEVEYFRFRFT